MGFGFGGDVVVDEYAAAVLADNDFLVHLDFHLALRRDVAEAATTGISVNLHHGQAVAGGATDAFVGRQVALVDKLLLFLRHLAQALFVFLGFGSDGGEFLALGLKVLLAVGKQHLGSLDVLFQLFHMGCTLRVLALTELNLKILEFDFLVQRLKLTVVAYIVLLFLVFLYLFLVFANLSVALCWQPRSP